MKINEFDTVRLRDGRAAVIVDLTKPGIVYVAEAPNMDADVDDLYEEFFVTHEEIVEVLPSDYPMPNPYAKREWWLEIRMEEYERAFGEQFPKMLFLGAPNAKVVTIVEECLESGRPYEPEIEPGVHY